MAWQANGDLVPTLAGNCPGSCDICLRVCPFGEYACSEEYLANERFARVPGISVHNDIGFYLKSYVGYSLINQHRENGSSGGMVTWMLETLLMNGHVDAVICVGPTSDPSQLFAYQIVDDAKQLRKMAGSRYYPVDAGQVIRALNSLKADKRYAFVGLPCTLKGLRLAMNLMPRLNRRIAYIMGLVCGHLPNRFYTEYLSCLSKISPTELISADFRRKRSDHHAGNYSFRAMASDNRFGRDVPYKKIKAIWSHNYFQVNSCNFCDDIFSEVADAVFMDAWLPDYQKDSKGNSIIVIRHPAIIDILSTGCNVGTCRLDAIPIASVSHSQQGVIHKKRELIGARLFYAESRGMRVPRKRYPADKRMYQKYRREINAYMNIQQTSKLVWPVLKAKNSIRFPMAFLFFSWPLFLQQWVDRFHRVVKDPSKLLRLVRKG